LSRKKNVEEAARRRSLKVVLESLTKRDRVLKRTYRLRGDPVKIFRDLCPEDRQRMKTATDELRTRKAAGETDLKIVDFRVIQASRKPRWRPILIIPCNQSLAATSKF
jgi:uncharacterized protein YlaI